MDKAKPPEKSVIKLIEQLQFANCSKQSGSGSPMDCDPDNDNKPTVRMTLVERVARAIFAADGTDSRWNWEGCPEEHSRYLDEHSRYLVLAEAAIEELAKDNGNI